MGDQNKDGLKETGCGERMGWDEKGKRKKKVGGGRKREGKRWGSVRGT